MCGNKSIAAVCLVLAIAGTAWAGEAHDVRGLNPQTDANDVIDAKCKSCHSRQRADAVFAKKADAAAVVHRMEAKGLKLTAKEKEILGIFSQGPFKKK